VIVYEKAALFFNALQQELGEEIFGQVLRAYAEQYRWRIATPDDFLQVAESVSGQDLDLLYNRWILSTE
jgi:aminopeptidase N